MNRRIQIFDTTLRDGEQAPGMSMNKAEKLELAIQLARLGVDVIEAGFPIASDDDFEAVKLIAKTVQGPTIAGLCRVKPGDIDRCWEAVKYAQKPRIHTFLATSPIHREHKLRMSKEQVLEAITVGVSRAASYGCEVEFSAEDASRTELDFMIEVAETAIAAGATIINIPDTVGYATPEEYGSFIEAVYKGVRNMDKAIISVHCHNDLGMAVANSLSAVLKGATQIECSINGAGERAGNAALEELIMAMKTRENFYKLETGIHIGEIYKTSRMLCSFTGMTLQANKAIVGKNAFAHESGIHQDGVLKERTTYEIMDPKLLGIVQQNLVLGKHSGKHAFSKRLEEIGYNLSEEELKKAFVRFKNLCDHKKEVTDRDLETLVQDEIRVYNERYSLDYLQVTCGSNIRPTATVGILEGEEVTQIAVIGNGPVDAVFKAINMLTNVTPSLDSYSLGAVTEGIDAQAEVVVLLKFGEKEYRGTGASVDVVEASARAYLNGINKALTEV